MTKASAAENHQIFAHWLEERAPDELVEIRAHPPRPRVRLARRARRERPGGLANETRRALESAGDRACRRDSFADARRLYQRALELAPTLDRHYLAAEAAEQLGELGVVADEMELVLVKAREAGSRPARGPRAECARGRGAQSRRRSGRKPTRLARQRTSVLPDDDVGARIEALRTTRAAAWWPGDLRRAESYIREASGARRECRAPRPLGRAQWRTWSGCSSCDSTLTGPTRCCSELEPPGEGVLDRARAEPRARRAPPHAGPARRGGGRVRRVRTRCTSTQEWSARPRGSAFCAAGSRSSTAISSTPSGRSEGAVRIFTANEDYGHLCEAQRALAEVLARDGRRRRGRALRTRRPRARQRPRSDVDGRRRQGR